MLSLSLESSFWDMNPLAKLRRLFSLDSERRRRIVLRTPSQLNFELPPVSSSSVWSPRLSSGERPSMAEKLRGRGALTFGSSLLS